jgi:hypothetical protein
MSGYNLSKDEKGKLTVGQRVYVKPPWIDGYNGEIVEVETYSNEKDAPVSGITLNVDGEERYSSVVNDIWLLPPADFTPDEVAHWNETYYKRERLKKEKEKEDFLAYVRNERSDRLKSHNYTRPQTKTEWGYIWITPYRRETIIIGTYDGAKKRAEAIAKSNEGPNSYTEVVSRTVTLTTSYSDWS